MVVNVRLVYELMLLMSATTLSLTQVDERLVGKVTGERGTAAGQRANSVTAWRGDGITSSSISSTRQYGDGESEGGDDDTLYHDYYGDKMAAEMDDWGELSSRHQRRCLPIPADMALCRGMNYTGMRLPNELGHNTLTEVLEQAHSWVPLANVHCHPDTRLFLCSLFAPICLGDSSAPPILPCRSLCQAVRSGCERKMLRYNFTWPDMLNCDRYPVDNDMCIEPQHRNSKPEGVSCNLCKRQEETVESIIDQYCSSDYVIRVQVVANTTVYADGRLVVTSRKKVYKGNLTKTELRRSQFTVEQATACRCQFLKRHTPNRRYVLMGSRGRGGRLSVTFLMPMGGKSLQLDQALRTIRKSTDICSGGPAAIRTAVEKRRQRQNSQDKKKQSKKQKHDKKKQNKKQSNKDNKRKSQPSRSSSDSNKNRSKKQYSSTPVPPLETLNTVRKQRQGT